MSFNIFACNYFYSPQLLINKLRFLNGAGKFTKDLGVPAKSGVSGGLLTVIPGIGSFVTFAPPLNNEGNTVKGIAMIHKLNAVYNNFNLFYKNKAKFDVTRKPYQTIIQTNIAAIQTASMGDIEGLSRFFNQSINLDQGDYDDRTPLHLASAGNHLECIKFLISIGVNVNPKDRWGATPLNDAQSQEVKDFLVQNGALLGNQVPYKEIKNPSQNEDLYRLLYAAADNRIELIKSVNFRGFKLNSYDYDGRTAIHLAASQGHIEIVKYLINHGADTEIIDARGNNPLDDAIRENRQEVVDYLTNIKQQNKI